MRKRSGTIRGLVVTLLMIPYLLVVLGVLSSYVALHHRLSFQAQVIDSEQSDLETMTLSALEYQNIKWTEEGKEFEYHGKMYDVANVEKQGANYVITCENDSFEDLVVNWMKSESKSQSKSIPQIQWSQPIAELKIKLPFTTRCLMTPAQGNSYSSFLVEIIPPPPRVS